MDAFTWTYKPASASVGVCSRYFLYVQALLSTRLRDNITVIVVIVCMCESESMAHWSQNKGLLYHATE